MLEKIKKYFVFGLVGLILVLGVIIFYQKRSYENQVIDLYNQIAISSETVEFHKNAYEKKTLEVKDLEDVLKSFKEQGDLDKETIGELLARIEKLKEEVLAANRVAIRWKEAYEAEAAAHQSEEPPPPGSDPDVIRTRVAFEKDFGYVGVEGYTLTNPAFAWVKVKQNRPLFLTMAITQSRDKSWNTYVTSSEDNVDVDITLSAVNPFFLKEKWYEKLTLDSGIDFSSTYVSPYAGLSYPVGPFDVSGGARLNPNSSGVGWYSTINYSWAPFKRR